MHGDRGSGVAQRVVACLIASVVLHAALLATDMTGNGYDTHRAAPLTARILIQSRAQPMELARADSAGPTPRLRPGVRASDRERGTAIQTARPIAAAGRPKPRGTDAVSGVTVESAPVDLPQGVGTTRGGEFKAEVPRLDLDAAKTIARAVARENLPRSSDMESPPPNRFEGVIARAVAEDALVESRGSNGETVLTSRHKRCVIPLSVPHHMSGMSLPLLCELRSGHP